MAFNPNQNGLDQYAVALGEEFRKAVDDNIYVSNTVMRDTWPNAEESEPGRWLALPILTGKNTNATSFGQYDPVPAAAQTIISAAQFPWSYYVTSINMSWQELRTIQGTNMRVDLLGTQLENAIASLNDLMGQDLTNLTKGKNTGNGVNALGIIEASDNGTNVNNYGSILRTGSNSFANWAGYVNGKFVLSGLGTGANDPNTAVFYNTYTNTTQGNEAPTDIYTTKGGIATYMNLMAPQQRFAAGDIANPGFGGVALFNAKMKADDHIQNPVFSNNIGANYYFINLNHTHMYYMGPRKGVEFIPWTNNADGSISQTSRYIASFQYASSQPRLNGQLPFVNLLGNL